MKFPTCRIPREESKHWNLPPGAAQVQNTCSQWNTHLFRWEAFILCVSYICLTFPGEILHQLFGVIAHSLIRDTTGHLLERPFLDHISLINDTEPVCAISSSTSDPISIATWELISKDSQKTIWVNIKFRVDCQCLVIGGRGHLFSQVIWKPLLLFLILLNLPPCLGVYWPISAHRCPQICISTLS